MIYSLTSVDREINTKKIAQVCDNAKKSLFLILVGEGENTVRLGRSKLTNPGCTI